jgi:hypothetical protein
MNWLKRLYYKFKGVEGKGSAFARVALHDMAVLEAKGKIVALDAANAAANAALSFLEAEAGRVHAAQDAISARKAKLEELL